MAVGLLLAELDIHERLEEVSVKLNLEHGPSGAYMTGRRYLNLHHQSSLENIDHGHDHGPIIGSLSYSESMWCV